jgi:hypothetical protein
MMRWRLVNREGEFHLLRKLFRFFRVCLSIICASVLTPSLAQVPSLAASTAPNAAGLGALAVGVHGLVNDSILEANKDLEDRPRESRVSDRNLDIKQADFPGGIQIWGSNPAFLWTSDRPEEEGIHVHAYRGPSEIPDLGETYGKVTIDGIKLEPSMGRTLMVQSALPSIEGQVRSVCCPSCGEAHFSTGGPAFTPLSTHTCKRCGHEFAARERLRKSIGNPLSSIFVALAEKAPRGRQHHDLGLVPETI